MNNQPQPYTTLIKLLCWMDERYTHLYATIFCHGRNSKGVVTRESTGCQLPGPGAYFRDCEGYETIKIHVDGHPVSGTSRIISSTWRIAQSVFRRWATNAFSVMAQSLSGYYMIPWWLALALWNCKNHSNDRGEPAVSYRRTGWVWDITGWSSSLQQNYQSF